MTSNLGIAEVASLVGDPTRATMLAALMGGRAMTAKELALAAHVTPQTASGHLGRLAAAGLITMLRQGRHHYHRLSSPAVGRMLESITVVAAIQTPPRHTPRSGKDDALRLARTCYDHLAGRLGVGIADRLGAAGHIVLDDEGGEVTASGSAFLGGRLGIEAAPVRAGRRPFCRPCLDWSERRFHLGGGLGKALLTTFVHRGWLVRRTDGRAVDLSELGRAAFRELFDLTDDNLTTGHHADRRRAQ